MDNDILMVQKLLDNTIKVLDALINKNILASDEREKMLICLKGIREKYFSKEYLVKAPKGADIRMMDEMIKPLDRMLLEAGKKRKQNTMVYILKAVIYAIGVGHRILTKEEKNEEAVILLKRRLRVSQYLDAIKTAEKMDDKIKLREDMVEQQYAMDKKCQIYKKQMEEIKRLRPDILEEIKYYIDVDDLSVEANEYLDMNTVLDRTRNKITDNQRMLVHLTSTIFAYELELANFKKTDADRMVEVQEKQEAQELVSENIQEKELDANVLLDDKEMELLRDEKIAEFREMMQNFVENEGMDMIDLLYEATAKIMNSPQVDTYIERSQQEFEEIEW